MSSLPSPSLPNLALARHAFDIELDPALPPSTPVLSFSRESADSFARVDIDATAGSCRLAGACFAGPVLLAGDGCCEDGCQINPYLLDRIQKAGL
jgi:hypothetical protein